MHSSSSSDYDQNQFFDDNDANGQMVMVWMMMDLSSFLAGLKLNEQFF